MHYDLEVRTATVRWNVNHEPGERLDTPAIAGSFLRQWIRTQGDDDQEVFGVVGLDSVHRLDTIKSLSVGSRTQCPVDIPKLLALILVWRVAGFIVFHNHPSGDLEPSHDDLQLTRRLVLAGSLVGVPLLDHILIAGREWRSLREGRSALFIVSRIPDHEEVVNELRRG